jgi:hypothetical protein
MSETKGMAYLDSIQAYAAPRIMCALGLAGSPCDPSNVSEMETTMKVYPNPSQGLFTIALNGAETIRLVEVFDIMGKRVLTHNPNASQTVIDLTAFANGIYTLKMTSDSGLNSTLIQKN